MRKEKDEIQRISTLIWKTRARINVDARSCFEKSKCILYKFEFQISLASVRSTTRDNYIPTSLNALCFNFLKAH